ncbi:cell division protein FtsZ [Phaeobacter gallaeciensis]|uniref:Cell division protein FtsZ n=1 Tax=Phaeobacter gallaeciensis TaxID=60890 RepID=A0AAD0EDK8_9RHOB|nr:cell division protein FtsZ [Phaeobacter gallaeciensis]AHD10267.1 cell division protein FtsZ [Phaeobacter gallaeciensis DSM 26640]ATE93531.1 cell division protein FtsZ [Phaeobacter gallaeciensis]ATE96648.1 cell division protein FtsZ [Phaeobacter gallaeciensis]ATF02195.1 cell division protein FtsZ [Phaeobacter gallaeciensis]ATF06575.1 cell division protein FtsZ [Phaeobacter gallaeciensis]
MTLNLSMPGQEELKPRITVFGVGGAGGNAVNNMIDKQLDGVDFVVANTDAQALQQSASKSRVQLGIKVTEGLGAGARPSVGSAAAEESIEQIVDHLAGAHMCFITAGMGGGTGTGAAPIIAQAARELGVLTVGVVTKPFQFEGNKRMRQAEEGVEALQKVVDTLIIIPNQNLFRLANEKTTFTEAFSMADDVLYQGVKGVTDLMVRPGLINLDFADVRAVMDEMGKAMMGTGEAEGEDRAVQAAEKAIANPLLDEISLKGAKGVLINITGAHDLTLFELDEAANRIREEVDPNANIIVGSTLDTEMEGKMRVSVVATGIDAVDVHSDIPVPRRPMSAPLKQTVSVEETRSAAPLELSTPVEQQAPAATAEPVAAAQEEPSLFSEFDDGQTAAEGQYEEVLEEASEQLGADGLPAPAYQGTAAPEFQPQADVASTQAESFVAPKAPAPGTPSPEAIVRLQAAAQRAQPQQPMQQQVQQPQMQQRPSIDAVQPRAPQPQQVQQQQPQQQPAAAGQEQRRFGLNSLIHRMTGSAAEGQPAKPQQPTRQQPPVQQSPVQQAPMHQPQVAHQGQQAAPAAQPQRQANPEQERIEIPAFLRRQAN